MTRALVLACLVAGAACERSLPEEGSEAAELYSLRCGSCHRVYSPEATKFATWEMILPRMEAHIARSGQQPLSAEERGEIVGYLRRNSG